MENQIFISYCRKDYNQIVSIIEEIEEATGIKCWLDLSGIDSGEEYESIIIEAINRSSIVLFMHSANSLKSKYVKKEVNFAQEKKKRVVPIIIDQGPLSDWTLFRFGLNDCIDFTSSIQKKKLFENLKNWVNINDVSLTASILEKSTANAVRQNIVGQLSDDKGCVYKLHSGKNSIGRKASSSTSTIQIVTSDRYMSRNHAVIDVTTKNGKSTFVLANDKNKNATFCNEIQLASDEQVALKDGDKVKFGKTILLFTTFE